MISFNYELDFQLNPEDNYSEWIQHVCQSENFNVQALSYIFCSDDYLLGINQQYLNHDYFTDIITFDYSQGKLLSGDIYISVDRVTDNALTYDVAFHDELLRVMAHGVLHLMGFKDKTAVEAAEMRKKENEKIKLFHVEQ